MPIFELLHKYVRNYSYYLYSTDNQELSEINSLILLSYLLPIPPSQLQIMHKTHQGHWTRSQHAHFLKALSKYGKKWKLIQAQVQTRTVSQVRSHAQKYFLQKKKQKQEELDGMDSDEINYDDYSSQSSNSSQILQKNQEDQKQISLLQLNVSKAGETHKSLLDMMLKSCIQCEQTGFAVSKSENSKQIGFPSFEMLQQYTSQDENPSHFLESIVKNYQYFSKGGTFIHDQ